MVDTNGTTDLDETLRVLASHDRRWILYAMMNREIDTFDELTSVLWTLSEAVNDEAVNKTQITIQLQQIHLPKLVDAGLIEHDPRNDRIVSTEKFDKFRDRLEVLEKWEDPAVQATIELGNFSRRARR